MPSVVDRDAAPAVTATPPARMGPRPVLDRLRRTRSGVLLSVPGAILLVAMAAVGLDRDAWIDEAFSIAATHQLRETYQNTAYTMATYYAQLKAWTVVGSDLWWIRSLSVLHAVAGLVVAGVLAVRAFGRRVAVWSTLFLGCSWMMVRYAHEARSFAFVVLLVALGWLATDRLVEDPTRVRWLVCHLVVGVLIPLTHGMAVLALAWQAVAVLASGAGRRTWSSTIPGWAAAVIGTALLYRAGGSFLGTPPRPTDAELVRSFLETFHGGPGITRGDYGPWLLVVAFSIAGALVCVRRALEAPRGIERFRAVMPVAWGLGTVAGIIVLNVFRPGVHVRYAVGAAPGLALLWALAAESARSWLVARPSKALNLAGRASVAPLVVMVVLLAGQSRYHERFPDHWTRLVEHIARDSRPGDGVAAPNTNRVPFDVAWSRLDDPPDLASVAANHPLGTVRRFGTWPGAPDVHYQLYFVDRVWLIERDVGRQGDDFRYFMDEFVRRGGFEVVDSWKYGEARLYLAEKTADRPAG